MKKAVTISTVAMLAALSVYGQGHVSFRTHTGPDDRVRFLDGSLVQASAGYRAELVYAPDGTDSAEFYTVAIRLGTDAAVGVPAPGVIAAGARTAPITRDAAGSPAPGGFALFQVRVWHPSAGVSWADAVARGDYRFCNAVSPIMRADTGNYLAPQPELPTELPLAPWGSPGHLTLCIPEPSVIGLGVLAAGALLLRRRK